SMVVVARDDDNIAIIDTKTNTVIGSQHLIDTTTTPDAGHVVAFNADGRILITDAYERTVRVVGFARGNTAPVATAQPTVGSPDLGNGTVIGDINISDPDRDTLSYAAGTVPTKGSVSFNTATGTYIYTPTQAARDAAAQS